MVQSPSRQTQNSDASGASAPVVHANYQQDTVYIYSIYIYIPTRGIQGSHQIIKPRIHIFPFLLQQVCFVVQQTHCSDHYRREGYAL